LTVSIDLQFEVELRERIADAGPEFDAESSAVLFTLTRAANLLTADFDSTVWRPFGVTYPGFRVVFVISVAGPQEPRTIAHLASVSRASISSVINTLERDGYVVRKRESADRRLVTVDLTDKGRQLWKDSFVHQNAREQQWASSLTRAEQATLTRLLKKLIHDRPRNGAQH
jgi:DNA-binding MarR family transcriptional regulator